MIRLAIVENPGREMEQIYKYIRNFEAENQLDFRLDQFSNALDFISDYRISYDIVLIGIELSLMDGLELGTKLRNYDKEALIIFLSNSEKSAMLGYKINAFDYLKKPVRPQELAASLYRAISYILERPSVEHMLWVDGTIRRVKLKNVRYVEVFRHYLTYHVAGDKINEEKTYTVKGQLVDIEEKFVRNGFYRVNKSYLVNINYITKVGKDSVFLEDVEISISRRRKGDFRLAFYTYFSDINRIS